MGFCHIRSVLCLTPSMHLSVFILSNLFVACCFVYVGVLISNFSHITYKGCIETKEWSFALAFSRPATWQGGSLISHCVFYHFWSAFAKFVKANISFVMSVCPSFLMKRLGSDWTDFHQICYFIVFFFENLSRKLNFHYNLTRTTGKLHEDQYTF